MNKILLIITFLIGMATTMMATLIVASAFHLENMTLGDTIRTFLAFTSMIAIFLAIYVYISNAQWRIEDKIHNRSEFYFKESSEVLSNAESVFKRSDGKLELASINLLHDIIKLLPKLRERMPQDFHRELFDEKVNVQREYFYSEIDRLGIYYLTGLSPNIELVKGDYKILTLHGVILSKLLKDYAESNGDIVELDMLGKPRKFPSGLEAKHVITFLSFVSSKSEEELAERLNNGSFNYSKSLRRAYPYLTGIYFFIKYAPRSKSSFYDE